MPTIVNFISVLLLIAQKDKLSISALPQRDNGRGNSHSTTEFRFPSSNSPSVNSGLQRRTDPLKLKNIVFQHMENQLTVFDRLKQTNRAYQQSNQTSINGSARLSIKEPIVRLRGGLTPDTGYLEYYDTNDGTNANSWKILCDPFETWNISEAQVVCHQLGYEDGLLTTFRGVNDLQDKNVDTDGLSAGSSSKRVLAAQIRCETGVENDLSRCQWQSRSNLQCNLNKDVIGIQCQAPEIALCDGNSTPFRDKCYEIKGKSTPKTFEEAHKECKAGGGHLAEIKDQGYTNAYLSEMINRHVNHQDGDRYWIGGLRNYIAGKKFDVWYDSADMLKFTGFSRRNDALSNTLYQDDDDDISFGITMGRSENSALTWDVLDLEERSAYICEYLQKDIGCLQTGDNGADYNGTASKTWLGQECLRWDTEGLPQLDSSQSSWSHNYCRNPGGEDTDPICFANFEEPAICIIPRCSQRPTRNEPKESPSTWINDDTDLNEICTDFFDIHPFSAESRTKPTPNNCNGGKEQFKCGMDDSCIFSKYVCDGVNDCSDGEDEAACIDYEDLFVKDEGFKIQNTIPDGYKKDLTYTNVDNAKSCAKICMQRKHCTCTSFSFNEKRKKCIISDRNLHPSDSLVQRKSWDYYQQSKTNPTVNSIKDCRPRRDIVTEIEAIRLLNSRRQVDGGIVEVKINNVWGGICDDGFTISEANVLCRQLGFELGAEEGFDDLGDEYNDPINLFGLNCTGNEHNITESTCEFRTPANADPHDQCGGDEKAGLKCRKVSQYCNEEFEWHCNSRDCIHVNQLCDGVEQCADGSDESQNICSSGNEELTSERIRLVDPEAAENGGQPITLGRVEVKYKGLWGTVCDDYFGASEAKVVCRMLGFSDNDISRAHIYDGERDLTATSGPIWIRFMNGSVPDNAVAQRCGGNENSLSQCHNMIWEHDHHCDHAEDIVIECGGDLSSDLRSNFEEELEEEDRTSYAFDPLPGVDSCGQRTENEQRLFLPRIAGGSEAYKGDHPWQASIRVRGDGVSVHWCGATIISHYHVVTAAHCLNEFPSQFYTVRVGDHNIDVEETEEQEFSISSIEIHRDFNVGPFLNNDIAVATLGHLNSQNQNDNADFMASGGIAFGQYVGPACLPSEQYSFRSIPATSVEITGWGKLRKIGGEDRNRNTFSNHSPSKLQMAVVPLIHQSECKNETVYGNRRVSNGMFCAGDLQRGGPDACQGDSGGPAVARIDGRYTLIGVTSWGYGCGKPRKPGVYTRVSSYVPWIRSIVNRNTSQTQG